MVNLDTIDRQYFPYLCVLFRHFRSVNVFRKVPDLCQMGDFGVNKNAISVVENCCLILRVKIIPVMVPETFCLQWKDPIRCPSVLRRCQIPLPDLSLCPAGRLQADSVCQIAA